MRRGHSGRRSAYLPRLRLGRPDQANELYYCSASPLTARRECNGNTRLVGSQGSTETYPSTTRTCITRLGYFPS